MKICFINNFYPPQIKGGAEKVIARMVASLKTQYETVIIALANPGQSDSKVNEDGVDVYRLAERNWYHLWNAESANLWKKFFWHLRNINNQAMVGAIKNILNQEQPTLVLTGNLTGLSMSLVYHLRQAGYLVAHYLFDYQLIDPRGTLFRRGRQLLKLPWYLSAYKFLMTRYFQDINCCLAPSRFIVRKHQEFGFFKKNLVEYLPTPAVTQVSPAITLSEIKLPLRLIYVGQIEPTKGVDFLIKALLANFNKNWELSVVGDGFEKQALEKKYLAEARIKFFGKKFGLELLELWQKHHLTVIPSLWWENFTTVAIESYQLGLPVLASDSGGTPELVAGGQSGLIFKANDQNDFQTKLNYIFDNLKVLGQWSAYLPKHLEQYNEENFKSNFNRIVALVKER